MGLEKADEYYLKAVNNYPFDMDEVIENLNYALSSDDEHCQSNFLLGRIYMEDLKQFDKAQYYFEQALLCDLNFPDTYKYFSLLKIYMSEFDQAMKLIDYALKVKGTYKSIMYQRKSLVYECTGDLKRAKEMMEKSLLFSIEKSHSTYFELELKRINQKLKSLKVQKKKSKKKSKKKTA